MFANIALEKPLAILDLETTGLDPQKDRIVEISILRVCPDGKSIQRTYRIDPGMPIPAEAAAIHGITDAEVAGEPEFAELAEELRALLEGCDLCGFNLKKFDLRMLQAEFTRVGRPLALEGRAIVDPLQIYHQRERRDLAAAVRFYLGREHEEAHSAAGDVLVTAKILDAMVVRYTDLPTSVVGLHRLYQDPACVDSDGFFRRVEGQIRFVKGKHRGEPLTEVARRWPSYLEWMLGQSFPEDTKSVVRDALGARRTAAREPVFAAT